ncbi:hypothetical protein QFZ76_001454 [Streptomyces sp. V4I2]|nr:hypothetical protein [Streptomyces sp. V4I2]
MLPDVANSFYSRIARGAADAAYDHGCSLVLCDSGDAPEREQGYFTMLVEQRAVGAVVVPLGADPTRLTRLRERGIPLALADRAMPAQEGCSVSVDDIAGGRIAVQHLLDRGARDILVVNGENAAENRNSHRSRPRTQPRIVLSRTLPGPLARVTETAEDRNIPPVTTSNSAADRAQPHSPRPARPGHDRRAVRFLAPAAARDAAALRRRRKVEHSMWLGAGQAAA